MGGTATGGSVATTSGTSSTGGTTAASIDWTIGRGTTACHAWQQAACDYFVKCNAVDLTTCANEIQSISCDSDTTATRCATALESASCNNAPTNCSVNTVVDTAPAIQGCSDLCQAKCAHDTACNTADNRCQRTCERQVGCSSAVGITLNLAACIAATGSASCSTTAWPAICSGVILT